MFPSVWLDEDVKQKLCKPGPFHMQERDTQLDVAWGKWGSWKDTGGRISETRMSLGTSERDWNQDVSFMLPGPPLSFSPSLLTGFIFSYCSWISASWLETQILVTLSSSLFSSVTQEVIEFLSSGFRNHFRVRLIGLGWVSFPDTGRSKWTQVCQNVGERSWAD